MNKLKFLTIGLTLIVIGFVACQKEKLLNPTNSSEFQYDVKSQINYSGIETKSKGFRSSKGSDQILVFKDMETFKATLSELERQTKELDSAFVKFYSDLDEEEINDKEEEINFNEEHPLLEFENILGFNSLRQKISTEEEQWLNQEELNFENDPDNYFIIEDEVRSLLNVDGEVQIGNLIYKLIEDGYFVITDGNLKTLSLLGENKSENSLPKNVIFVGNDDNCSSCKASGCNSGKSKWSFKTSGSKRIKWTVSHVTYPWGRYAIAKTKNYKKKKNRWKKYRTYTKAKVYGYISDANGQCDKQVNFNPNGYYASGTAKKIKHKISVSTKTKSGWVKGYHYGAGGITYTSTLTW